MKNRQSGFTLIEIVMVLVLLGILAAVAIPKYYDLQAEALERSADAVAAEYQSQINGAFANELLSGTVCATARKNAITAAKGTTTTKGVTFTSLAVKNEATDPNVFLLKFELRGTAMERDVVVPSCAP